MILSAQLADQFADHLRKLGREERHVRGCRHYIDWWIGELGKVDLRKVGLRDLRRCLKHVDDREAEPDRRRWTQV